VGLRPGGGNFTRRLRTVQREGSVVPTASANASSPPTCTSGSPWVPSTRTGIVGAGCRRARAGSSRPSRRRCGRTGDCRRRLDRRPLPATLVHDRIVEADHGHTQAARGTAPGARLRDPPRPCDTRAGKAPTNERSRQARISATAWQAAPSPRPVNPRPSVPVARTETRSTSHVSAAATWARISAR
jgi:hypothetical protein